MGILIQSPNSVLNGKVTVTTAGTRVSLGTGSANSSCISVTLKALSTNTGFIYVGGSTVSSLNGFQLNAADTVSLDISNINAIYIDSSVSGEGVTYIGIN